MRKFKSYGGEWCWPPPRRHRDEGVGANPSALRLPGLHTLDFWRSFPGAGQAPRLTGNSELDPAYDSGIFQIENGGQLTNILVKHSGNNI